MADTRDQLRDKGCLPEITKTEKRGESSELHLVLRLKTHLELDFDGGDESEELVRGLNRATR